MTESAIRSTRAATSSSVIGSTLTISFEFLHDVIRNRPTFRVAICKERIKLFPKNTVARRELWTSSLVGEGFFFRRYLHTS